MRINKLLSNYGYCSRKDANRWIEEKRVVVNGRLCEKGQWVEENDEIFIDGERLLKKKKVYLALNKPEGVTCTAARDVENNIIEFLNYTEYIFPVGRLDKASEGLIIITNDGDFASKILEADNCHEKEYIVTVDKPFNDEFIHNMSSGVEICNTKTRPCKVEKLDATAFKITLTQGINRQIRRMCRCFGYTVIKLKRIRIMNIKIDGIEKGCFRELTKEELKIIYDS